jgi:DNA-directed RNA polymerase subunit L/DNA-directed RNA polymerase alpha subunit
MIYSDLQKTDGITTFKMQDFGETTIDVSLVNSIRRTILSDIPNVAFYFNAKNTDQETADIVIDTNDSPLHNEFMAQRLSMVPIHLPAEDIQKWDDWNDEEYKFIIDVENKSSSFLDITSADIQVWKSGKEEKSLSEAYFPKNKTTGDHILLTKLPPMKSKSATQLKASMTATKDTPMKHACWAMTSLCTFENDIDEDLRSEFEEKFVADRKEVMDEESAKRRYATLEYQRAYKTNKYNEPNSFIFKLESECGVTNEEIFHLALSRLILRLKDIKFDLDAEPGDKTVMIFEKDSENICSIQIDDEDHTLGNLLQAMIYNMHVRPGKNAITYIGYYVPHPLQRSIILKVKSSLEKDNLCKELNESVTKTIKDIKILQEQWLQFAKLS